jgi:hypothetical protein
MKQTKAIVFTTMLTLLAFGAIVYTSCRKDRCKTLNCQNGGTCSDGFCICATGYTGTYCQTPNVSSIAFRNETFTPVTLTINGANYSVDTGKFITFTGSYGDTIKGTAFTHGTYGLNVDIDPFKIVFPVRGTTMHDLNVNANFFFLMATNNNSTVPYITQVHVYNPQSDTVLDVTSVYNDGRSYHIGYYEAFNDTKVALEKTPLVWKFSPPFSTALTKNQSYNAIIN